MTQARRLDAAAFASLVANHAHPTGAHVYRYSLTQRVFLTFQALRQPLDRGHIQLALDIGDLALKHAITRLTAANKIAAVEGRRGFYELVPGATLPEDGRGKSAASRKNLKHAGGAA